MSNGSSARPYTLRQRLGVLVLDLPRMLPRLWSRDGWLRICNRHDSLDSTAYGNGVRCRAEWSSDLHACQVFPELGRWLMARALRRWPIRLAELGDTSASPDISFVIPHRGRERLPLLRLTLASILAQRGARVECIVVEQSAVSEVDGLPGGVRHIHLPHTTDSQGWRKSWAFNVGVEAARAEIVVCHDGDILVPDQYGSEILFHLNEKGMDAVHLQRFLFCLDAATTAAIQAPAVVEAVACERVDQNWVGGTLAIRKSAYWQIGGFDEGFVGWGGEDKEFFDRCRTVPQYAFGYLPFIHLWHTPQDEKVSDERVRAVEFMKQRLAIPPRERVLELRRLRDEQYQGVITP